MKEKVIELAGGKFRSEECRINIDVSDISEYITADEIYQGELRFQTVNNTRVKGIVYSDNPYVTLINPQFNSDKVTVGYRVDAFNLVENDKVEGSFYVVSSAGEYVIGYTFTVRNKSINSSIGEIKNMFHFMNLVKSDYTGAVKLFNSPRFPEILDDLRLKSIYYSLIRSNDVRVALEEFLIEAQKKGSVELELNNDEIKYDNPDLSTPVEGQISVSRKKWGYVFLNSESDNKFLVLDSNFYESFDGDEILIDYKIDKSKLHAGINYAVVSIYNDSFKKSVTVRVDLDSNIDDDYHFQINKHKVALLKTYLDFRKEIISSADWVKKSLESVEKILAFGCNDVFYQMIKAHLYMSCQKYDEAGRLLEAVLPKVSAMGEATPEYCYYLYVSSLSGKDRLNLSNIRMKISDIYENACHDWRILWILFYLDEENDSNSSLKLIRLKEQFYLGCKSPVMYYEAAMILRKDPKMFRVLDDFEIQVVKYSVANKLLDKNATDYVMSLISRIEKPSKLLLKITADIYESNKDDLYLEVLVLSLVRNDICTPLYREYYLEAINRSIKVNHIFENYIRTFDAYEMPVLPKPVLLYFLYDNDASDDVRAYVYANVCNHMEEYSSVYEKYKVIMSDFVYEHIKKGDIDDNYILLYKKCLDISRFDPNDVGKFPNTVFTHKIKCRIDNVTHIIVRHKELSQDMVYPVKDKVAFVQIYTKDAIVCLRTGLGRRYVSNGFYEDEKLFDEEKYTDYIKPVIRDNIFAGFYFAQKYLQSQKIGPDSSRVFLEILKNKSASSEYKTMIAGTMIDYYYEDIDYYEALVQFIVLVKDIWLTRKQKVRLLELLIVRSEFEACIEFMEEFRVYPENPKRCLRLLTRTIGTEAGAVHDNDISVLALICARACRYDENVLMYLIKNFNMNTMLMYDIWLEATARKINCDELSERILAQCIFTGTYFKESFDIFKEFWNHEGNDVVLEAYLNYCCYLYFVKKQSINEALFPVIRECIDNKVGLQDICKIAYLYHCSQKNMLSETDGECAKTVLTYLVSKKMYFEFYRDLSGKIDMPYEIADKCFIEYRTGIGANVDIHYRYTDGQDTGYSVRNMDMVFPGIYVAGFTIFYKEFLNYYITSSENGKDYVESEKKYLRDNIDFQDYHGRFSDINDIIISADMNDYATARKYYRSYRVREYVTDRIFDMIGEES